MRIFYLANNWVGWQVLRWLQEQGEEVVGISVHPTDRRKYTDEILHSIQASPEHVFDGSQLRQPDVLSRIADLDADIALSVYFGYILKPSFIEMFPKGVINLHPAYLPYNRGAYPNIWSIIEGTPAGATLHYIDTGVDTGDMIAQRRVEVEPIDTGASLYRKLELCCLELFKDTWPLIRHGIAPRIPQTEDAGTSHKVSDTAQIDGIDLDRFYTARELINLLRARTFPPYTGAYFIEGGRKIAMQLQLDYKE